ncbi:peptide-methionine (S)-S-oxide reductase MsrA [Tissierella carlieri]|jgi:peptide-methionine (S)-S-oxide reductase|uniref:peptide-methionine (S)-S-oxide reductase MsrA n=1 Tax=Tissierella TaxID=41273 RepID=UPI00280420CB|nr:peptide-methionine (S)-S-oxide reductase MsrA [uncultured Tissierella sp.]MDU5080898.1 peptide-methionine (S)-S-oxide reductase MsrA [Bacillota bacterium]
MKEIYLAGGCFWGVEEYMSRIDGIVETRVGYANGIKENPTYKEVCTGTTGHAETTYVKYDESIISLEELLNRFWQIIDPTILNRQGPDIGNQYRTGIYYVDSQDINVINKTLEEQKAKYDKSIVTEIIPLKSFYDAEEYHQDYLKKNPGGYCHIDLSR